MIQERNTKRFCCESPQHIENYHQAVWDTQMWDCHHKREIDPDGTRHSVKELMSRGLYFNRPASELVFLSHSEHQRVHHLGSKMNVGRPCSEATRKKIAISNTNNPLCSRPVVMSRISDGMEKSFPSQHEACRWLVGNGIGTNPSSMSIHISECCRGIHKTAYGAKWRFA